ncbi:sulfotransferase [Streptacidiphilus sp. P02-A3a]|uniref:sulfotransferase family protein n=1 Tax=Streptacidiphilus sp. P02-A3a TaxID=2704468 RepID=UPI0015FBE89F|nr:sulfotransferase [Streptacidiphilus sp. P02-A3a]QMU67192.1 sulfotransferase [Streptacidiphilus sp. P02-A3a]
MTEQALSPAGGAERPVFLIGPQRSGSTLLRELVGGHPQVCLPRHTEIDIAARLMAVAGSERWPQLEPYRRQLLRSRRYLQHGNVFPEELDFPDTVRSFIDQSMRRDADARVVGATVHQDFDQLPRLWPKARYVYLNRDPRAVVNSAMQRGWAANAWCAAEQWMLCLRQRERLATLIDPVDLLVIRYEDLVVDPVGTVGRILGFAGAEGELAEPVTTYPERADAWRSTMSPLDISLVERRLGPALAVEGYRPATEPRPDLRLRGALLRLDDQVGRLRLRLERDGVPLTAATTVTRQLRLTSEQNLLDRVDTRRRRYGEDRHRRSSQSLVTRGAIPRLLGLTIAAGEPGPSS